MAEKKYDSANSIAGVEYSTIRCPRSLNYAIKRLRKLAGFNNSGEYLASLVRDDAVNYAYQLSDDEFDAILGGLDQADDDLAKQEAFNAKHTKEQWHKLEKSGKLGKYTGKKYL